MTIILGEAALDSDGVLHGWCWSPDRPDERLVVEVVIDDEIASTLVASRFREDVRHRKFGDGYHGFTITLTRQIGAAEHRTMVVVRERTTQTVFWHKLLNEFAIPPDFDRRIATARGAVAQLANAGLFEETQLHATTTNIRGAFARLGHSLQNRTGSTELDAALPPFSLALAAPPAATLLLDAGPDPLAQLQALRRAAAMLRHARVEISLTDDGADPATARLQRRIAPLRYVLAPRSTAASRRNLALRNATGELIYLFAHVEGPLHAPLATLAAQAADKLLVCPAIAAAMRRIAPGLAARMTRIVAPPCDGLQLALPRAIAEALGPFDAATDDGAGLDLLDWVLRAASRDVPLALWDAPSTPDRPAAPAAASDASRRFAQRWILGPLL